MNDEQEYCYLRLTMTDCPKVNIAYSLYPSWISTSCEVNIHANNTPSAQPEIIRCKDCKYNATSKKCLNPNSFFLVPADDDFCSYAERKEVAT